MLILLLLSVHAISARPQSEEDSDDSGEEWKVECGSHNKNGIEGGSPEGISAKNGEWPHACIIFHNEEIIGSASLIAPEVLVSVAHKLENISPDEVKIRCGEYDLKNESEQYEYQERNVKNCTFHPYYTGSKTVQNDIAVIHTTEAFKQAPNVNTICLPDSGTPVFTESKCYSMGWDSAKESESWEPKMTQVQIDLTNSAECENSLLDSGIFPFSSLDKSWICSQDPQVQKTPCEGGAGNSLVCQEDGTNRNVLAGLAAFSIGGCSKGIAEIFASVSDAICFIHYETTCKYGSKYLDHYYYPECNDYAKEKIAELEDLFATARMTEEAVKRNQDVLAKLTALKESCNANLAIRRFQLG